MNENKDKENLDERIIQAQIKLIEMERQKIKAETEKLNAEIELMKMQEKQSITYLSSGTTHRKLERILFFLLCLNLMLDILNWIIK